MFLCTLTFSSGPKRICMSLLHYAQVLNTLSVRTHHLAGVAFKMTSSANNLYCSSTCNSNAFINTLISVIPLYLGGSYSYVPIQRKDRFIHAHILVDTSCILYCQFSRPTSESDVHELKLLQLSAPSVVGST
jgi:hypothetical protein